MIKVYENFEEMANDFKDGDHIPHQLSRHSSWVCTVWQNAIVEFARALDLAGIQIPKEPEIYEKFWANIDEALIEWGAGLNRRELYSKQLGEMSLDEARQRYDFKGQIGGKLIIPRYEDGEISEDYYLII